MQIRPMLQKLIKTKGIMYIAVGIFAAVVLLLWPSEAKHTEQDISVEQYRASLEAQAEEMLSQLEGVGRCRVMISFEYGFEYVYASNQSSSTAYDKDGNLISVQSEKNYFSTGDGKTLLVRQKMPKVTGIAVVCPGAGGDAKLKITSALSALFGIGSNRISVQS